MMRVWVLIVLYLMVCVVGSLLMVVDSLIVCKVQDFSGLPHVFLSRKTRHCSYDAPQMTGTIRTCFHTRGSTCAGCVSFLSMMSPPAHLKLHRQRDSNLRGTESNRASQKLREYAIAHVRQPTL